MWNNDIPEVQQEKIGEKILLKKLKTLYKNIKILNQEEDILLQKQGHIDAIGKTHQGDLHLLEFKIISKEHPALYAEYGSINKYGQIKDNGWITAPSKIIDKYPSYLCYSMAQTLYILDMKKLKHMFKYTFNKSKWKQNKKYDETFQQDMLAYLIPWYDLKHCIIKVIK